MLTLVEEKRTSGCRSTQQRSNRLSHARGLYRHTAKAGDQGLSQLYLSQHHPHRNLEPFRRAPIAEPQAAPRNPRTQQEVQA
jgi:hypothetical protein